MRTYYDVKDMLKRELDEIIRTGELSAGDLETIDKILNSIKNSCKIIMYEEYSDDGHSYNDGMSGATRRDSRGRYSRRGGYYPRGGYSYDGNESKVQMLRDMMNEVDSDDERRTIQKIIRRMENN